MAKRSKKWCEELPVLHPHAAGIDVGASELFVAVSADRDPQSVRSFPTFTRDLNALADWLQQCGIRSVAMESTSACQLPSSRLHLCYSLSLETPQQSDPDGSRACTAHAEGA